ncbi:unnamed protein product, partial [Brachionus calyciflorus]
LGFHTTTQHFSGYRTAHFYFILFASNLSLAKEADALCTNKMQSISMRVYHKVNLISVISFDVEII